MTPEALPMALGETLKGTDADSNLINTDYLGRVFTIPVPNSSSPLRGNKSRPCGDHVEAVLMRNTSGGTLLGKRFVNRDATAGYDFTKEVNGYTATDYKTGIVLVDPFLPSGGVAANDIFWGVIKGTVLCLTPTADADFKGDIAVGAVLVACTAAGTTTTAAGRVCNHSLANNTDAAGARNAALGAVGFALSAKTTANTNADILVKLNIRD